MDYEHKVTNKVSQDSDKEGFPRLADYGVTKGQFDDYLFDKQAALDSAGGKKAQYTVSGVLVVLPVIVLSAFPKGKMPFGDWAFFVAIIVGVILALVVRLLVKATINVKLKRLHNADIERYINDVLAF